MWSSYPQLARSHRRYSWVVPAYHRRCPFVAAPFSPAPPGHTLCVVVMARHKLFCPLPSHPFLDIPPTRTPWSAGGTASMACVQPVSSPPTHPCAARNEASPWEGLLSSVFFRLSVNWWGLPTRPPISPGPLGRRGGCLSSTGRWDWARQHGWVAENRPPKCAARLLADNGLRWVDGRYPTRVLLDR